jgi:hypothetical protein
VPVTLWTICGNPFSNSTRGSCSPQEYVGPDSKRIFANSTFAATCCVSGRYSRALAKLVFCQRQISVGLAFLSCIDSLPPSYGCAVTAVLPTTYTHAYSHCSRLISLVGPTPSRPSRPCT